MKIRFISDDFIRGMATMMLGRECDVYSREQAWGPETFIDTGGHKVSLMINNMDRTCPPMMFKERYLEPAVAFLLDAATVAGE